jgi:hypothetical protein
VEAEAEAEREGRWCRFAWSRMVGSKEEAGDRGEAAAWRPVRRGGRAAAVRGAGTGRSGGEVGMVRAHMSAPWFCRQNRTGKGQNMRWSVTLTRFFRGRDSGGEYLSDAFCQFLSSEGTLAQLSCPGAHAQNGVAERKQRQNRDSSHTFDFFFCPFSFLG